MAIAPKWDRPSIWPTSAVSTTPKSGTARLLIIFGMASFKICLFIWGTCYFLKKFSSVNVAPDYKELFYLLKQNIRIFVQHLQIAIKCVDLHKFFLRFCDKQGMCLSYAIKVAGVKRMGKVCHASNKISITPFDCCQGQICQPSLVSGLSKGSRTAAC